MENENGFQAQSLVNCAGADIQPHIKETGEGCSDGHEWRSDGATRLYHNNSDRTELSTGFVADWFLPGKPAVLTLVAGTKEESVWSKNREQSQGGTKCIAS